MYWAGKSEKAAKIVQLLIQASSNSTREKHRAKVHMPRESLQKIFQRHVNEITLINVNV